MYIKKLSTTDWTISIVTEITKYPEERLTRDHILATDIVVKKLLHHQNIDLEMVP